MDHQQRHQRVSKVFFIEITQVWIGIVAMDVIPSCEFAGGNSLKQEGVIRTEANAVFRIGVSDINCDKPLRG
jgi:hypothetical protein